MSAEAPFVRERIRGGDCIGCIWLALGSVAIAELAADSEPDAIVFDLQHGLWERQALESAIGIVRVRSAPLVRVARNGAAEISAALDAGAIGVIVPLVETAEEARQAVDAARYPPQGHRSGGGVRPLMDFKRYVPAANEHVLVAVMIETKRGVENAAAIAATPGVDMVFIGTGDLALSLGVFPDLGPKHEAAIGAVQTACQAAGTACGVFTLYSTMASDRRRQGFQCVVLGDDTTLMHQAFKQTSARFRARSRVSGDPIRNAVALVTGTSRGIGPHLVRALLDAGAKRIYCAARDPVQAAALIATAPDRLVSMKLDVTSDADAEAAAGRAGDVTLLVNNAGFNFNQAFSSTDAMANARTEVETNYLGPLRLCRAFAPTLRRNGGGTIVNMLSILAHMNLPMMGSLCASKAAALSLTQALRAELASQGTRVVGVLPGAVDTDMTRGLTIPKLAPKEVAAAVVDGLRRGLDEIYPGDMAAGVAFGLALDPKEVERQFAQYLPPAPGWSGRE